MYGTEKPTYFENYIMPIKDVDINSWLKFNSL